MEANEKQKLFSSQQFAVNYLSRAEGKIKHFRRKPNNDIHLLGPLAIRSQNEQTNSWESEQLNNAVNRISRPRQHALVSQGKMN